MSGRKRHIIVDTLRMIIAIFADSAYKHRVQYAYELARESVEAELAEHRPNNPRPER